MNQVNRPPIQVSHDAGILRNPLILLEARAGVEPTYTDLQWGRVHGARGAQQGEKPRATRLERIKRTPVVVFSPIPGLAP
jgi:hypothetical protein